MSILSNHASCQLRHVWPLGSAPSTASSLILYKQDARQEPNDRYIRYDHHRHYPKRVRLIDMHEQPYAE